MPEMVTVTLVTSEADRAWVETPIRAPPRSLWEVGLQAARAVMDSTMTAKVTWVHESYILGSSFIVECVVALFSMRVVSAQGTPQWETTP